MGGLICFALGLLFIVAACDPGGGGVDDSVVGMPSAGGIENSGGSQNSAGSGGSPSTGGDGTESGGITAAGGDGPSPGSGGVLSSVGGNSQGGGGAAPSGGAASLEEKAKQFCRKDCEQLVELDCFPEELGECYESCKIVWIENTETCPSETEAVFDCIRENPKDYYCTSESSWTVRDNVTCGTQGAAFQACNAR